MQAQTSHWWQQRRSVALPISVQKRHLKCCELGIVWIVCGWLADLCNWLALIPPPLHGAFSWTLFQLPAPCLLQLCSLGLGDLEHDQYHYHIHHASHPYHHIHHHHHRHCHLTVTIISITWLERCVWRWQCLGLLSDWTVIVSLNFSTTEHTQHMQTHSTHANTSLWAC